MVPIFLNTEHAIQYGKDIKKDIHAIDALKTEREALRGKYMQLMNEGKEAEALHIASGQCQFLREALEVALKGDK